MGLIKCLNGSVMSWGFVIAGLSLQVSDNLLHEPSSNLEVLYFCAQTLRTKVRLSKYFCVPSSSMSFFFCRSLEILSILAFLSYFMLQSDLNLFTYGFVEVQRLSIIHSHYKHEK